MGASGATATRSPTPGNAPARVRVEPDPELEEIFRRWDESASRSRARRTRPPSRRRAGKAALRVLAAAVVVATAATGAVAARVDDGDVLTRVAERGHAGIGPARGDTANMQPQPHSLPTRRAFAAAERFAASRAGLVSFAVIGSTGRLRSVRGERGYVSASVVKALLLAAELRRIERDGLELDSLTSDLLARMITYSDNAAADAIYLRVGDDGLYDVAARAGMRDFAVSGHWTTAQLTADDMARLMAGLDQALAGPHAAFASAQLASIVPEQRWGIPDALGDQWRIRFKGGWRGTELGQLVHQAAALERGDQRLGLAVLTDGQPTMDYGIETVEGIASRLLGSRAPAPRADRSRRGRGQSGLWERTFTIVPPGSRSMKRRTPHSSSRRG